METQLPVNKSLKPKQLNFDEMWKVHKKYIDKDGYTLIDVANYLYPKRSKLDFSSLLYYVINGLNSNHYPTFDEFIKGIDGRRRDS